uniref:Uncharacterized protein n=1 Tax=Oryza nivara TaxID=4536 RepID=A0A0E0I196_ORYNI
MAPPSPIGDTEAEVIILEDLPPVGVPGAEVIDLESPECKSGAAGAKSRSHSSAGHPKQQSHGRISLSPQSKAFKVSGTRGNLQKTAARVVSRYRQSRVLNRQKKDNTTFGINCRCQPKCIVNITKDFDDRKKELIAEIGFDGILDIKLTKVNRQFWAWLLSKVDPKSGTIVTDFNQELPFDVSAMVGPQAYKELKSYVQDGFNQIDEILPSIADFVDISNLKTATEAANMFKKAFKYNMAATVKIATRAAVRNVIDTIEDMQGPLHP